MGNQGSQPTNRTGRKAVTQKLENAKKTGVLSLTEHGLDEIPTQVYQIQGLQTLDLSKNNLTRLGGQLATLSNLKKLNFDENKLQAGSLLPISKLSKLQSLSCGTNQLGTKVARKDPSHPQPDPVPPLPKSLKQLKLDANHLSSVPRPVVSAMLAKLEKLDLSSNNLASVPTEIANLISLSELNLDNNCVVSLPEEIGALTKLKVLSLKNNRIQVTSTSFTSKNPQPLPEKLFTDTPLIDLNLHGNKMTSTQLNEFVGYQAFLKRREKVKSKGIYGGALTNLSVCGLE